jgi:pimeloyl-ACP methyl ester carboxylesterase
MRYLRLIVVMCCLNAHLANADDQTKPNFVAANSRQVEDVSFVARIDGSQQKYVLVRPNSRIDPNPSTMLIALHGHGSDRWQFVRQQRGECRAVREFAAEHAMLVVSPDYRAKTSWMGPKAEADLVQIIKTVKNRLQIERVIICGGSMGGTAALTFAALHPDMVDGVVSLNGTADLVHYERFSAAIAKSFGGSRAEKPEEYRRRSALFFPDKFNMPLAATTGGQDSIVPPESVLKLLEEVRKRHPNVLSIHRPKGGHSTNFQDTKAALEFVAAKTKKKM